MIENKLEIIINAQIEKVFEFTTNPENTHLWCDGIIKEERNSPLSVGSIYKSTSDYTTWSEYEVVGLELNKYFKIKDKNSNYEVEYFYSTDNNNFTKLIYLEKNDILLNPLKINSLEKLKVLIERI